MVLAFIGLGSNLGDGRENLQKAWHLLGRAPEIHLIRLSRPYGSNPVAMESTQWFTNAVGALETDLSPFALLSRLLMVEKKLGRDRAKGKDRTVDLDLLFYGDMLLDESGLTLPHPEIENRLFVLAPLEELAPELLHPQHKKSVAQILRDFKDPRQEIHPLSWHKGEK